MLVPAYAGIHADRTFQPANLLPSNGSLLTQTCADQQACVQSCNSTQMTQTCADCRRSADKSAKTFQINLTGLELEL
jgi:hypothetical protein